MENPPQTNKDRRIFIGLGIKASIAFALEDACLQFADHSLLKNARWTEKSNLHLTLKFLGPVSEEKMAVIDQALRLLAPTLSPVTLEVTGFGAFPNLERGRLIFATVEPTSGLSRLRTAIETELIRAGFPQEPLAFVPHITMARIKDAKDLRAIPFPSTLTLQQNCNEVTLFETIKDETGSHYRPLVHYTLSAKQQRLTPAPFADAHTHLADERWPDIDAVIGRARESGVGFFLQAGVDPKDWNAQRELKKRYSNEIFCCFGLHPYWISAQSTSKCDQALAKLESLLNESYGLGETGLDFRSEIVKDRQNHQVTYFEKQLELALKHRKVPVLHLVRCHHLAPQILKQYGIKQGLVHSFNSNAENASSYLDQGLFLSVGGPVLKPGNKSLHEAVEMIPLDNLVLETDSPDQSPPGHHGLNEPWTLRLVADKVADIKKLDPHTVLERSTENVRRLFGLKF